LYNDLRNMFLVRLNMNLPEGRQMYNGIISQNILIDLLRNNERAKKEIGNLVGRGSLFLPFDSSLTVRRIDISSKDKKESAKSPTIFSCCCVPTSSVFQHTEHLQEEITRKFLFKIDDIRKDVIVMKCSNIVRSILAQDELLRQLPCITYKIQPMTKCVGFMEVVEGKTLSAIPDLQSYLQGIFSSKNGDKNGFIQSAAIGSVLVYLFGVGDRHRDNLLVTTDGKLVNIDFGFLEGDDPMRCPYARIPEEIINEGDNRKLFFEWCKCIYLQLRRYAMHFHSLFMFLHTSEEHSEEVLKKFDSFIQDRFCVECDQEIALERLLFFLETSQNSTYSTTLRDWLHKTKRSLVDYYNSFFASMPEDSGDLSDEEVDED